MSSFIRRAVAALALVGAPFVSGAPALTRVRDILYRADGARYEGTVQITWKSFSASDGSPIGTQGLTIRVIDGVFDVKLAPTTTSAGAKYEVRYNSQGQYQYLETWSVPPSAATLRIRDVRVEPGSVVGPPPVNTTIALEDVTGLVEELDARPRKGGAYAPSRAAVIDPSGALQAASGNPADCIRVDGTSGPCGTGGGASAYFSFADGETPSGIVNGTNTVFKLAFSPAPASSLELFRNGIRLKSDSDFSIAGNSVDFAGSGAPQGGDVLTASYRYADPTNPMASLAPAQVICSSTGSTTSATSMTALATCNIPAGVLRAGDRIEIRFDYSHQGGATPFTVQVRWGQSAIVSRGASADDQMVTGRVDAAVHTSGTQWSAMSWGSTSPLGIAAATGAAPDDFAPTVPVTFLAQASAATSDTVTLRSFTVIRYPAQSNP